MPSIGAVHAARELPNATGRPTQGWEPVTLPDTWAERWPDFNGAVWYRIVLRQDCAPGQAGSEPVALLASSISLAGEVYLNDTLLWRDTDLHEPLSRNWNIPRYWILPDAAFHASDNTLWIRALGRALILPGLGAIRIGPQQPLLALHERLWWLKRTTYVVNLVASLCIAGLFAAIWLLYRKQAVHGWFALLNFAWVAFIYNVVATHPWPFDTVGMAQGNAVAIMAFCSIYAIFSAHLQKRPLRRWQEYSLAALTLGLSLPIVLLPERLLQPALTLGLTVHFAVFSIACLLPLVDWLRRRKTENFVYVAISLGFLFIAMHDTYIFHSRKPDPIVLTPYANLITMAVITVMLGSRIAAGMRRTERFNAELQTAVEQACRELETTMDSQHQTALANSRLQERLQFIRDLHDGFGSALVRAIAQAERHADGHAEASRHVSTLKSLRDDLRNVMDGGSTVHAETPATPAEWMAPTRHRFSTLFDELDVSSHWSYPAAWPRPPGVALCMELTRLLEEALSNVLKHSAATEVDVTLAADAQGALTLEVRDNGVGFDIAAVSHEAGGIGLSSMRARVARLGGRLELESRPGYSLVRARLAR